MTLKSSVVIFEPLESSAVSLTSWPLQPHWPHWPHWPQQPLHSYFLKTFPHPDDSIIPGTKMTNMSPFMRKE